VVKRVIPWLALGAVALSVHTAWNVRQLRRPNPPDHDVAEKIAVLIPARDEQDHIAATIQSAQNQDHVGALQIHVLDDGSHDATCEIAQSLAELDPRIHIHQQPDQDPPAGWLGKNYACAQLASLADQDSTVFVFLDADVVLEPHAVSTLAHELRSGDFQLVAPYPRQTADGLLERLIQPLLVWSWATTVPLAIAERRQWASMSVANGQLMAFDVDGYRSIGGHATVRGEVIEDVALMRQVRQAGLRAATIDGSHLATCRMYSSTRDLVDGYTKSAWNAFGGVAGSIAVNSTLVGLYVVPALAALFGSGRNRRWGLVGYTAGVAGRILVARRTGERALPDALAHPGSVLAFVMINGASWWRHLSGTTQWKGRAIHV